MSTVTVISRPARANLPVAAAGDAVEQEKRRIQSAEFTAQLTAAFHQGKRRALAQRPSPPRP